jgi:hypothetical protein
MNTEVDAFRQLKQAFLDGGLPVLLDALDDRLRDARRFHDLFKSRQMRIRHELGLPLLPDAGSDEATEHQREQLEEQLCDVCREIGTLLVRDGQIRDGWAYLRVLGDVELAAGILAEIRPNEDNVDALIEVLLHEGVDPSRGFAFVLDYYGTCNAVTMFEGISEQLTEQDRQAIADRLVTHLHTQLVDAVVADVTQKEGVEPAPRTLEALVKDREWLFADHACHVDTAHLAATMRAARCLDEENSLRLALDLTEYGKRLDQQYHHEGEEPFAEIHLSHALYFAARLGKNVEEAVEYFRDRAESLDVSQHGLFPMEVLMELLCRLGRYDEAVDALARFAERENVFGFVAQRMLPICCETGDYERFIDLCSKHGDLLGYATGLACADEMRAR